MDLEKVNLDTIKPWITHRVTELLNGYEDDVVIEFIFNLLETTQVRTMRGGHQDRVYGYQDRGKVIRTGGVVTRTGGGSPGKYVWSSGQGEDHQGSHQDRGSGQQSYLNGHHCVGR